MEDKKVTMQVTSMEEVRENDELFEEVEEVVTASWTGCSDCCN